MIRKKNIKSILLLASMILVIIAVVGGTLAFLLDTAGPVENTFTPSEVPIEVMEYLDGSTKSNVRIKNTGNVDAYIRAKVIVNWKKTTGEIVASVPAGYIYDLESPETGWVLHNGYYYFTSKVEPQTETETYLIPRCTVKMPENPEYELQVDIIAQSIQADGEDANGRTPAEIAWGVNPATLVN